MLLFDPLCSISLANLSSIVRVSVSDCWSLDEFYQASGVARDSNIPRRGERVHFCFNAMTRFMKVVSTSGYWILRFHENHLQEPYKEQMRTQCCVCDLSRTPFLPVDSPPSRLSSHLSFPAAPISVVEPRSFFKFLSTANEELLWRSRRCKWWAQRIFHDAWVRKIICCIFSVCTSLTSTTEKRSGLRPTIKKTLSVTINTPHLRPHSPKVC